MNSALSALTALSVSDKRAALAAELATKLMPVPEIMKRHDVTAQQLRDLMQDPQFKHMVKEFRREWNSPLTAKERVKLKASLAVEDGLIELYAVFKDPVAAPQARLEAFKQLINLAEMGPRKDQQPQGQSFSLTLNLGGDAETVTIDAVSDEVDDATN